MANALQIALKMLGFNSVKPQYVTSGLNARKVSLKKARSLKPRAAAPLLSSKQFSKL